MAIVSVDGGYLMDVRPAGKHGPRFRRKFKTRKEAKQKEAALYLEYEKCPGRFGRDNRRLSDLVKLWYSAYGSSLKDAKYRYSRLLALCQRLGDSRASQFKGSDFADYRVCRLREVSVSTVNHEMRYLRAVFSELIRLGYYHHENPMLMVRGFSEPERELTFLTVDEIRVLFTECAKSSNSHCLPVARLCLATGARWSEVNNLLAQNLFADHVVYSDTKNGKSRAVPVDSGLSLSLRRSGYPVAKGRLFDSAKGAFRSAVRRSGLDLPRGQLTHVLRHTFASHFMMNGGNILTLQRVLGHSDLKVTMRYAHLAPDYLKEVVALGPLGGQLVDIEGQSVSGC